MRRTHQHILNVEVEKLLLAVRVRTRESRSVGLGVLGEVDSEVGVVAGDRGEEVLRDRSSVGEGANHTSDERMQVLEPGVCFARK